MASVATPVSSWSTIQVCSFLESLELAHLCPIFKQNAVSGDDLVEFSEQDFERELGLTPLQTRKVMKHLRQLQGPGAATPMPGAPAGAPQAGESYAATGAPVPMPDGARVAPPMGYPPVGAPGYAGAQGPAPAGYPAPVPAAPYAQPANYSQPPAGYPTAAVAAAGAAAVAAGAVAASAPNMQRENRLKAANILGSAHGHLKQSMQLLHEAKKMAGGMAVVDVIEERPFGFRRPFLNNMMNVGTGQKEQEMVEKAEHLVKAACSEIGTAQRLCPDIPNIDRNEVMRLNNGFVGLICFGGLAQAKRAHEIGEMAQSVERMASQVRTAEQWLTRST